jgi:hypothetical protein
MKYKGLRPGWKGGEPSEEDSSTSVNIRSSGEESSNDEDDCRKPGAQKVAAGIHEQPESNVSREHRYKRFLSCLLQFDRREATPSDQRGIYFPYDLVQRYEIAQSKAFIKPDGSHIPATRISTASKDRNRLPDWVHPKWTKVFLPTLAHVLFISKRPFQDFKPSSPVFVATVRQTFRLVYSRAACNVKEGDILVEEVSRKSLLRPVN